MWRRESTVGIVLSYLWIAANSVYLFGIGATRTSLSQESSATKVYCSIPIGAVILISVFLEHFKRGGPNAESEPIVSVAKSVLSLIYYLQLVFLAIRLDGIVQWKWSITLLPFWFFFAIMILFTMVTLLRFVASILDIMTGRNKDWRGIVLNFWIGANMVGGLVFAAKIQVGVVQIMDGSVNGTKELGDSVVEMLLYLAALSLFTTISLSWIM